jgi:hypothetical protein
MKNEKRKRVSRFVETAVLFAVCLCMAACHSRPAVNAWDDARLAAEQRLENERLRNDIERMGEYQLQISERIDNIAEGLVRGLERCDSIEDVAGEIDRFVRAILDENQKLRNLQRTDGEAAAGER